MLSEPHDDGATERLARRHRIAGWLALLFFLTMGLFLEGLHGVKAELYLLPGHALRRELWTLAHAHGTLFAILNIVFAGSLTPLATTLTGARRRLASHLMIDGALLVPIGFFLGGAFATEHDPWSGVYLVPIGAVCLIVSVALVGRAAIRS